MTLGELPAAITCDTKENLPVSSALKDSEKPSGDDLDALILSIIQQHTDEASGIGRVAIQNELRTYGIQLSDDKLRRILHRMKSNNKITIGRGRTGCMIL